MDGSRRSRSSFYYWTGADGTGKGNVTKQEV